VVSLVIDVLAVIVYKVWYIPESTKFLLIKGNFEQVAFDVKYICNINDTTQDKMTDLAILLDKYKNQYDERQ
jgi:hypothetical protein